MARPWACSPSRAGSSRVVHSAALGLDPFVSCFVAHIMLHSSRPTVVADDITVALERVILRLPRLFELLDEWLRATGLKFKREKCVLVSTNGPQAAYRAALDMHFTPRPFRIAEHATELWH